MKCSEAMNPNAAIVRGHDSVRVVAETMVEHHVDFLPVVTSDNDLVGTISEHQLLRDVLATGLDPFHTSAVHISTIDALTCGADDDLSAAEQKMKDGHQSHIVVIGGEFGKTYLGLLTLGATPPAAHAAAS
jgi:CBS domain-containing protein